MKSRGESTHARISVGNEYRVYGTVRDKYQRPMKGTVVKAFDKDIRGEQMLGETKTDPGGNYSIVYSRRQFAATDKQSPDVVVRVYDKSRKVLKESAVLYNAAAELQVDITLAGRPYQGMSEFESVLETLKPYVGKLPISQLAEDSSHHDVTFLTNKTGLSKTIVESLAISFQFEKGTGITAAVFYGLVRQGPSNNPLIQLAAVTPANTLTAVATQVFGVLMREDIDKLMSAIHAAVTSNLIPFYISADMEKIKSGLLAEQKKYMKGQPQTSVPPDLNLKLNIAGLQGDQIAAFTNLFAAHLGPRKELWAALDKSPAFKSQEVSLLQSVFSLSQLTGEHVLLTDQLVKSQGIKTTADLPKLAAFTTQGWTKILEEGKIQPPAGTPGQTAAEQTQSYAAELERTFTAAFPSAAFTARLQSDSESNIPNAGAVKDFLVSNPDFDLLTTRIGKYFQSHAARPDAAAPQTGKGISRNQKVTVIPAKGTGGNAGAGDPVANQIRRIQRVFKLTPTYSATNALLGNGLDSAQKIYRMGKGNFINKFGKQLGQGEAVRVYRKATQAYSQSLVLAGNLKSLSDASHLTVFPNYDEIISPEMSAEIPDLDTLFGHADFCECEECRSVYGAAAYLTDILRYLDDRVTSISCGPGESASVKDALLRRRPDIGDIDLDCDNTNTQIPYIDIANEIMEDFVAPREVTLNSSYLPKFVAGTIDSGLLSEIVNQLKLSKQTNTASLLTANAAVSDKYQAKRLTGSDSCVTEDHWIIRDKFVVLKATKQGTGIGVRLVHQTLLTSDEINANPEYVNLPAYDILKTAKRPFSLPFDLFETEGETYLDKLGTKKAELTEAFRPEHEVAVPPGPMTQSDLDMAYAYLGINEAERSLIFQQDLNQTTYWGSLASGTTAELDLFMDATGLEYEQVLQLLKLKTINPAGDSVILNQDLSCDTDKKQITNLNPTKFDAIHRFLRLWRKTSLSMEELDALVRASAVGNGVISPAMAYQLHDFLVLQQLWGLTAFQYLAFFQTIDTTATDNLYDQLFQNRSVTNPLNPDFAIEQVSWSPVAITDVHRGIILGALGLAPDDLDTLVAKTDGKLSLGNLSYFYRITLLASALSVSISDLYVLFDLINIPACADPAISTPPAADPATTYRFFSAWQTVVSSQFSAGDLDYVLRYRNDSSGALIASDDQVAVALGDLQTKLLQVEASTVVQSDPHGQLLTKWLADPVLNWNGQLVDKLLDILGTQDDTEYQQKIDNNTDFLLNLRVQYHDQVLTADLSALPAMPAGSSFSDLISASSVSSLASQVSYDSDNRQLKLIGYMSATDQSALKSLPGLSGSLTAYQNAVDQLYNGQQTSSSAANVFFGTAGDIPTELSSLLSDQIAARYALFLNKISPVYAGLQKQDVVQKEICSWFKINKDIASAVEASQPNIYADFTAASFINKENPLTASNYGSQFNWYQQTARVSFFVSKLKLTADDLTWLFANAADVNSLDLWNLPVSPVSGPVSSFPAFQVLIEILKFEQKFPAVKKVTATDTTTLSVYSVIDEVLAGTAAVSQIEADLCTLTGWDQTQLDRLINAPTNYLNLSLSPAANSDLRSISILLRLARCFDIMKSLGAAAADCVSWTKPSLSYDDAVKIMQSLKAQNESDQWLSVTQPLQDTLRQSKRDALVAYLIANPPSGIKWLNSNDLYNYFLIDVEMCSCQPTSRIVQATNSVQQFVQRCFLNLEPEVTVDLTLDPDWSQWEWMKYFRVWQANRKIFLYPENWIEPELLPTDMKSSFFSDLQNDILKNEVTQDNVESAFMNYLEKLDEVSRLEIKAMWYEDDKETLHVVGRTYGGDPRVYYYRQLVENRRWTPWVKIDQDIQGDHVVLTVFNHRIYLFWAIFSEKSYEIDSVSVPSTGGGTFNVDKQQKYWQIQMAFTEYRNGKWLPKKVSKDDDTGSIKVPQSWDSTQSVYTPDEKDFIFTPLDLPHFNLADYFNSNGKPKDPNNFLSGILNGIETAMQSNGDLQIGCYVQNVGQSYRYYSYKGTFDLDPCKGYPVVIEDNETLRVTLFDDSRFDKMLDEENQVRTVNTLATNGAVIINQTPGQFKNLLPLQMSFIDRLMNIIYRILVEMRQEKTVEFAAYVNEIPVSVGTFLPYFYQDKTYTYFVQPELSDNADFEFTYQDLENLFMAVLQGNTNEVTQILGTFPRKKKLYLLNHFYNFYHPLVCYFMRTLFDNGMDAMMSRDTQLKNDEFFDSNPNKFDFNSTFQPTGLVYSGSPITYTVEGASITDQHPGYPKGDVDFDPKGGYSEYNWEMFFHAPLMIAKSLSQNQQFEDADHWFKYIFNPTDGSSYPSPDKYWVTKPFFENVNDKYTKQNIDNIMLGINSGDSTLIADVTDWRNNPSQPHYIAQYRTVAYQKTTVMNYLDHLIAWGDSLYMQDTMESVTEAEQLYVLASEILGPKPEIIPPAYELPVDNYYQLEGKLDSFSNALVEIENLLPMQQVSGYDSPGAGQGLPNLETLYFCIPPNDQMMGYYDTISSRLFNIRHCLNLEGQYAPLALFAPPINPGMLVRAAAAGLDIGSVLSDMNSPLPHYRFAVMIRKASELCGEVKSLGSALLQTMEKKDAEDLALLRSSNGISVLKAVLEVKKLQVQEATHNLEALQKQQALVQVRIDYYQGVISAGLNAGEKTALALSIASTAIDASIMVGYILAGGLKLIPDFVIGASGFGGSPTATAKTGGHSVGDDAEDAVKTLEATATALEKGASLADKLAEYDRRKEEWQDQLDQAKAELQQVEKQILAATVRQSIANQELQNQQLEIDNAQAEDEFMHSKFTNSDLYSWMISQLSTIYFQSYQLAYALAKQAEQTYRYELALSDSSYIKFGYWDSLKKGLLAGERLMYDIHSMDKAYHDQNAREYEMTKHISLAQLDPSALQLLKSSATHDCWINLPEELFDMDYPGHYMRRVKSVSLTIPCVAGPYTTISCKLTMTKNSMRVNNTGNGASKYPRKSVSGVPADDPRFRDTVGAIQSIAISSGQNDSGLFEMNFNDERYLPFEGAGAISQWHLELPAPFPQFDYNTISDIVMHLKYTARDGGEALAGDAAGSLKTKIDSMLVGLKDKGLMRAFSAKHDFPTEWYAFLNPASSSADQQLALDISGSRFPYFASLGLIKITSIELVADTNLTEIDGLQVTPAPTNTPLNLTADNKYGALLRLVLDYTSAKKDPGSWTITNAAGNPRLTSDKLRDLILIVHYEVS